MANRGSISRQTIKSMFTGERPSRSPSRSRSPTKRPARDIVYTRTPSYQTVDGQADLQDTADNVGNATERDTER